MMKNEIKVSKNKFLNLLHVASIILADLACIKKVRNSNFYSVIYDDEFIQHHEEIDSKIHPPNNESSIIEDENNLNLNNIKNVFEIKDDSLYTKELMTSCTKRAWFLCLTEIYLHPWLVVQWDPILKSAYNSNGERVELESILKVLPLPDEY